MRDLSTLTPGAKAACGLRRAAKKILAAIIAARKYPIPATASTVVRVATDCARACGILGVSVKEKRGRGLPGKAQASGFSSP